MSKKKYTEDDLRAAIAETRVDARVKQIERSAGIMQELKDEIVARDRIIAELRTELDTINGVARLLPSPLDGTA